MLQKVPIQRLRRERRENEGQQRTARACDTCRQRKMKCDGNRPMCTQCQAQGLAICAYSEAKAVKVQRQLESANLKIKAYEELLKDISHRVGGFLAKRIASILNVCLLSHVTAHQSESINFYRTLLQNRVRIKTMPLVPHPRRRSVLWMISVP